MGEVNIEWDGDVLKTYWRSGLYYSNSCHCRPISVRKSRNLWCPDKPIRFSRRVASLALSEQSGGREPGSCCPSVYERCSWNNICFYINTLL